MVNITLQLLTLPIEQRLDYLTAKTALRIASSPSYSAITAARPEKRVQYSPLEVLTNRLQKNTKSSLSNLEEIIPYTAPPWWTSPPTVIKPSKKEAEPAHKNLIEAFPPSENLFVYTDGSGINEKVGASATAKSVTWNSFLGSTDSFTVYSGELYGILLGAGHASHVEYRPGRVFICVDNQASICAIGNSSRGSGQHIVQRIVEEIEKLRKSGYVIETSAYGHCRKRAGRQGGKRSNRVEVEENKKRRDERTGHRLYRSANAAGKRACFGKGSNFGEKGCSRVERQVEKGNTRSKAIQARTGTQGQHSKTPRKAEQRTELVSDTDVNGENRPSTIPL